MTSGRKQSNGFLNALIAMVGVLALIWLAETGFEFGKAITAFVGR